MKRLKPSEVKSLGNVSWENACIRNKLKLHRSGRKGRTAELAIFGFLLSDTPFFIFYSSPTTNVFVKNMMYLNVPTITSTMF